MEGIAVSRQIDLTQPLTDEDQKYLADRGRTVEQEQAHQDTARLAADRITGDADALPSRIEYARRTGVDAAAFGDPRLGQLRKARQL